MPTEEIDIAKLLSMKAGVHLGDAFKIRKEAYEIKKEQRSPTEIQKNLTLLRRYEAEACIEAVILFQTSMEAIINEEIDSQKALTSVKVEDLSLNKKLKALSFKNKWSKSYTVLAVEEDKHLLNYFDFYNKFRVPITHPRSRYMDVKEFTFPNVYKGLRFGWHAIEILYKHLGKSTKDYSWEIFCNISDVPCELDFTLYPDYLPA